jgi:HSP20 family molecular chaperone IbpA
VCERNGKMLIQADLPGMKRDDVHVRIEQDEVIIQGERRQDESNQQGGYYRSERSYGSFYRTIPLPGTGSGATYGSQQASGTSGSQQSASGTSKGTNT